MNNPKKLLFVVNVDWFFLSHRLPIALAAKKAGFDVVVAAADTGEGDKIKTHGLTFIPLPFLEEKGSPLHELKMIKKLTRFYREIRPDIVHHVTVRPVLYGSIAAKRARVPALVNLLSGLGYFFMYNTLKSRGIRLLADPLFRYGFSHPNHRLILQNGDDKETILKRRLLTEEKTTVIRGSGVDTSYFVPDPDIQEKPRISYFGRLLWIKGIEEFIDAAKIVHKQLPEVEFHLYGKPYPANPLSVPDSVIREWKQLPFLIVHGHQPDILRDLQTSAVVCLPAHGGEGVPKALLEAAAAGKPLLATDVPGCREIVEHGVNGYLVPAKDAEALAERMIFLMKNPQLRKDFGNISRKKAVEAFSVRLVETRTLEIYNQLLGAL